MIDWALVGVVAALMASAAFAWATTYWPVTRRVRRRISCAEIVHYIPQQYLAPDVEVGVVRLRPASGKRWLYLYEGQGLFQRRAGAVLNHARLGQARRWSFACVVFNGADAAGDVWAGSVRRRPLDGAVKVAGCIEVRARVIDGVVPWRHRWASLRGV